MERILRRRVSPDLMISAELARDLSRLSMELGRQLGVLIDRTGRIEVVIVGDKKEIMIPVLPMVRSAGGRLKGLRCVHTHLNGEGISEDDLMDLLFLRLDLMVVIKVQEDGLPERLYPAHLAPQQRDGKNWSFLPPVVPSQQEPTCLDIISDIEGQFAKFQPLSKIDAGRDRAILISVSSQGKALAQDSMDELVELAKSDDVVVLDTVIQRRHKASPHFIIGRGKLGEVMLKALLLNANLLVFDQELNASQTHSIIKHTELRVIDRTQLILDIFARRALSREGQVQIEMAQLKYMLPRLESRDDALSRLSGGIGTRGPGETKLEVDRRRIKDRLAKLEDKLKTISKERHHRRERRRKKDVPVISLVGYTNAGKSTLLNALTKSKILAEDKLFATLDPTSRRLRFPEDVEVIITDTVGFIRDLPKELLKAFQSTLEELHEADVLVHVVDVSNPRCEDQIRVVNDLLEDLDLYLPTLMVFNKIDLADPEVVAPLAAHYQAVPVCALRQETFAEFLNRARDLVVGKSRLQG
ncbi:MAG: GTPase HflX [Desulfobulbaceae bacterium]|nr:GTPase HflX [Desulfobulbaceae bacterium]